MDNKETILRCKLGKSLNEVINEKCEKLNITPSDMITDGLNITMKIMNHNLYSSEESYEKAYNELLERYKTRTIQSYDEQLFLLNITADISQRLQLELLSANIIDISDTQLDSEVTHIIALKKSDMELINKFKVLETKFRNYILKGDQNIPTNWKPFKEKENELQLEIPEEWKKKIPIGKLWEEKGYTSKLNIGDYDCEQIKQIEIGLEKDVDVTIYANPKFSSEQMEMIRIGLEEGLEASKYANPELDLFTMLVVKTALDNGMSKISEYNIQRINSLFTTKENK